MITPMVTLVVCVVALWLGFSAARRHDRFNRRFGAFLRERHPEIEIERASGYLCLVTYRGRKHVLDARIPGRQCRRQPERFTELVEEYLSETVLADGVPGHSDGGAPEAPAPPR